MVFLQAVFVQGLRILGQKLNDPFGDDDIDFSVIHFCVFAWRNSQRLLRSEFPQDDNPLAGVDDVEDELEANRIEIGGPAWEKPTDDAEQGRGGLTSTRSSLGRLGHAETIKDETFYNNDS